MCGNGEPVRRNSVKTPMSTTPDLFFLSLYTRHTCVVNCFLLPSSVQTELVFRYREAMVSYLEISSVVLIPVPFCTLLQGDEYEPSEVGRAGCSQSHWVEANHQQCQENRKQEIVTA